MYSVSSKHKNQTWEVYTELQCLMWTVQQDSAKSNVIALHNLQQRMAHCTEWWDTESYAFKWQLIIAVVQDIATRQLYWLTQWHNTEQGREVGMYNRSFVCSAINQFANVSLCMSC